MDETDEILHYGHPILRRKAERVREMDARVGEIIERMTDCLERSRGLGLAAPQIGCGLRIAVYDIGEGPCAIINPSIHKSEGLQESVEGCLCLPGLYGDVPRAARVVVKARDACGRRVTIEAEDLLARVLQHEMDHLEGILFVDRVKPETVHWVVGDADQEGEPERVYTALEDALKVFEARAASRRGSDARS